MKRKLLLIIVAFFATTALWAYDFKSGDLYYNITDHSYYGTVEVTYQKQWSSDNYSRLTSVVIPESVIDCGRTYRVTSIGVRAFHKCISLTSVTLPNSVTSIGDEAFSGCGDLTSIIIPDSVNSIGYGAFWGCASMISVTIGNGVTTIGNSAFSRGNSLRSIIVEKGNTVYDSRNNCNAIIETATNTLIVGCPSTTIPNDVMSIGDGAFSGCEDLTSIIIPNSVTSIGKCAFEYCSGLTSVTIPNNVTKIGRWAFDGCSGITSIIWNARNCESFSLWADYPFQKQIISFVFGDSVQHIPTHICGGMSNLTSVTIPNYVTSIGDSAFSSCCSIVSVTIPNGVTSIENGTFSDCSGLTSVTIPNSVTSIGDYAFYGCGALTSVAIPKSVTNIGSRAFCYCSGLTSITIPDSVTSIGDYTFCDCSGLTSVTIGNGVTNIGESAFYGCRGLTSVSIGNGVTSIGDGAFSGCSGLTSVIWNAKKCTDFTDDKTPFYSDVHYHFDLRHQITSFTFGDSVQHIPAYICNGMNSLTSLTIPHNVTRIGRSAFADCSGLASVMWNAKRCGGMDDYEYSPFYSEDGNNITSFTFGKEVENIPNYLCYEMKSLTSVIIPNSVDSIGNEAFRNCRALISVSIGNGVTHIGYRAFDGTYWWDHQQDGFIYVNTILYGYKGNIPRGTELIVKDGTTCIGYNALSGGTGIFSITIPSSVTVIQDSAFYGCQSLRYIVWNAKKCGGWDNWRSSGPFESVCENILSFVFGNEVDSIPAGLCKGMSQLTSIEIPNSVTSIGDYAFSDCTGLTSIAIPNSVTSIGDWAFSDCSGLTSVTIPNSVTSIGSRAFSDCSGLTSITIPNSVTSIGDWAFYGCSGLTSITIPNSVTSIGVSAFYSCSSLTSVTLPNSVTSIADKTFRGCSGLTSITIPDGVTSIGEYAFEYCSSLTSITIPNDVASIGRETFSGCSGLTSVTIPNSVTSIGESAFYDCSGLTSVTIPNSVTSIGESAFYDCSGLTSAIIGNSVTSIGTSAFRNCTGLTYVTCYASDPPSVSSYVFLGVNIETIPLYVPMESIPKYNSEDVWKDFLVLPISAMPADADEPVIDPEGNKVTITWPATEGATSYTIEISNDSALVCTLVFDAGGALKDTRYAAPARYATQHTTQAEATGSGFRFVVEGLDYATTYTYTITATDIDEVVLTTYNGTFTTADPYSGTEDVRSTQSQPETRKVFRNGQMYIIRGEKTYTATGSQL